MGRKKIVRIRRCETCGDSFESKGRFSHYCKDCRMEIIFKARKKSGNKPSNNRKSMKERVERIKKRWR